MKDIRLSIVIPTHNRPELLIDSINSAIASSKYITEILVIDDASSPPVNSTQLQKFDSRIRVLRNDEPQGIARVRVQGANAVQGNWLYQLDDDDLLAANTLDNAIELLNSKNLDILFIGVKGFGAHADYFNKVQTTAVERLLRIAQSESLGEHIYGFKKPMSGLLQTVPSAFQHPLTTTKIWREVNELRFNAYKKMGAVSRDPMQALINPFNESEWSLYAVCKFRIGFLKLPIYLARCEGERNYSVPNQSNQHMVAHSKIKQRLYLASKQMSDLKEFHDNFKESYLDTLFNLAYNSFYHESRIKAWSYLFKASLLFPQLRYFKFFIRTCLPR